MPILQLRCSLSVAAFLLCVGIGVPPRLQRSRVRHPAARQP